MSRMEPVSEDYAAGDKVLRQGEMPVTIDAAFEKPGWQARLPGTHSEPEFPGTPLKFEGRFYEVKMVEPLPGGRVAYHVSPWDRRFPLRNPQDYSREACRRLAAERAEKERRGQASFLLLLLSPLVGLLPADDQYRLDRELGLDAARTTLISGVLLVVLLGPFTILATALSFGGMFGAAMEGYEWVTKWQLVIYYFFVESALRAFWGFQSREAMGSLPVVLCVEALRYFRGRGKKGDGATADPDSDSREGKLQRRAAWVETFAIVWGAVDEETQSQLEEVFDYDRDVNTKRNIYVEVGIGGLAVVTSLAHVLKGPGPRDFLILLFGILALTEGARRLFYLERGKNLPSVIQVILKPLAQRLMAGL